LQLPCCKFSVGKEMVQGFAFEDEQECCYP
jgi:hypothetical protein